MSITKYVEDGQVFWKVYVHVRSTTIKSKRFQQSVFRLSSEAEARREEKKLYRQLTIEAQRFDGLGLCWEDVVQLWWKEAQAGYLGKITERSALGYLSIIHKWTRAWNSRPAAEISRVEGRNLLIAMDKAQLAKAYQNKVKNIVNKVYEWGIEYKHIIGPNFPPLSGITINKDEEKAPDIYSIEEIRKFLSAAKALNHRWYPIWAFAVLTGMRSGELHALTWDQIDFEKNLILVDRSYDSNVKCSGPTKGRYWRTVPINASLRALILDLKNDLALVNSGFVLPRIKDWDNGDQAVALKNFLKSIKMRPIKFHALRACFATQMLANGVSAPIVMKIGGWKKSSTMDIYLRLAGVDSKGATDCLQFIPENVSFGDNVVSLFGQSQET